MSRPPTPRAHRTVAPRADRATGSARPQWMRVARTHLGVHLFVYVWLWLICIIGVSVAISIVAAATTTVNLSIVQFIRQGPLVWVLFSVSILVATTYLTPHVANGMTRRSFVRGGLLAAALAGLLHAATAAALVLLEGALYNRMGWDHAAQSGRDYLPGIWELGLGPLLVDHVVAATAGTVAGLLVGMAYYRLGGWWGTLALPLTVLPILGVMFLSTWSDVPFVPANMPDGATYGLGALLVLAAAGAFALLGRRVPISRTES